MNKFWPREGRVPLDPPLGDCARKDWTLLPIKLYREIGEL